MVIANDLHTMFKARREAFEVVDIQPTNADLHHIVEDLAKLLYTIPFDKERGKHNLIGLIMYKADYSARFGALLPGLAYPEIYYELIANGATRVIRAKAEAIHRARITN